MKANEQKVETHEQKLAEKDQQLKIQNQHISDQDKEINYLKMQIQNRNIQISNLKQSQTRMIIPEIEDGRNFHPISSAFQWRFNPVLIKSTVVHTFSPPFYNILNSHCFQLAVAFIENNYQIALVR